MKKPPGPKAASKKSATSIKAKVRLPWIEEVCKNLLFGSESARTLMIDMRGHMIDFTRLINRANGRTGVRLHPDAYMIDRRESNVFFEVHGGSHEDNNLTASVPILVDGKKNWAKINLNFGTSGQRSNFVPVEIVVHNPDAI